ncbi:MAG: toll/interleukin-1 receptor domain-containing protein [Hoeflea sp.]|uniref:toll/interleukin-1 receptor domain-containing protein n=1 Tax=Hoeflea sp. TaxID=1940281 RepID=UPI003EF88550
MAEPLPPVPEGGFVSTESLESWLKMLPTSQLQPVAQVLACRTALRVLPNLHAAFSKNIEDPQATQAFLLSSLRVGSIARVALKYPTLEIESAGRPAVDSATSHRSAARSADIALSAADAAVSATRSAESAESAIYFAHRSAFDSTYSAAMFADSVGDSAEKSILSAVRKAVATDARALVSGTIPLDLLTTPLWPSNDVPEWWNESRKRFQARLELLDRETKRKTGESSGWALWIQWHNAVAQGRPPWGLPSEAAWKLEKRIALGNDLGKKFWGQEPEEINREIAEWITEARNRLSNLKGPIFVSYNDNDKADTIKIGTIIEEFGFDVFAQYRDMPPGSNFITEMNKGLDGMGKFVPVYSPEYVTSKVCEAEWNAAFNMDRNGERRLIIGLMLKPATLPPLYRQIVHVPLYNLTEPQLRDAVRDALIWDGKKYGPARSREIAAEAALPAPTINTQGQVDVDSSPLEAPFIDDDLVRLPGSMRRHIEALLEALEGSNCSKLLTRSFKNYLLELTAHGATPNLPDLIRAADLIENARLDAEEDGESWYKRSSKTAFDQFAAMHEQLKQHFPLIMLRDISIDRTSIEPDRFDEEEFATAHKVLAEAANEAHKAGAMSDDYCAVMELREQQRRDIESLSAKPQPDPETVFLHPADRKTPDDIKKRFLFDVSGSSDKLLSKTAQATQIADSDAIKGLTKAASDLLKSIWG